jgi:DMSO reductase anchor subunit
MYAPLVTLTAAGSLLPASRVPSWLLGVCELAAIAAGIVAVACSAMIYVATRRAWWNARLTFGRFAYTSLLLGNATCTSIAAAHAAHDSGSPWQGDFYPWLLMLMSSAVVFARLWFERHWTQTALQHSDMAIRGPARLLTGDLQTAVRCQHVSAITGAVLIPLAMMFLLTADMSGTRGLFAALTIVGVGLILLSEICERYLFFAAVVAPRMPGAMPR